MVLLWWSLVVFLTGVIISVPAQADKLKAYVSIVPQQYFVEKIGRDLVDVSIMVQPGASPATYEPKPRQMAELASTDVYFAIDVPFEKTWLDKIAAVNPRMLVIHTESGIEKIPMSRHGHLEDDENNSRGQAHQTLKDPHIWLSPPLVMIQARNILVALTELDQRNRSIYEENYKQFILELVNLDMEIRDLFLKSGYFMVFHPSWGYFAKAYGLEQIPIEIEGKEPKPTQLRNLIKLSREKKIRTLFAQPEFSTKSARLIAREINGQVVLISPLAKNWAENLKDTARKIKKAMR
jgi:zinc transport system substrate-binding protein